MNILKNYDKENGFLRESDIIIEVKYLNDYDIVICYSSIELDLDGHIHCGDLSWGIQAVVEECLGALIFKMENNKLLKE